MTWSDLTALVATLPIEPGDVITKAEFTATEKGFKWFLAVDSQADGTWELSGFKPGKL